MSDRIRELLPSLMVSLLASVLVGAFVGYMTVNTMVTELRVEMQRVKADIVTLTDNDEKTRQQTQHINSQLMDATRLSNDRLVRIEVRLDLLLEQNRRDFPPQKWTPK